MERNETKRNSLKLYDDELVFFPLFVPFFRSPSSFTALPPSLSFYLSLSFLVRLIFVRTHFWQWFREAWHRITDANCLCTHTYVCRNENESEQSRFAAQLMCVRHTNARVLCHECEANFYLLEKFGWFFICFVVAVVVLLILLHFASSAVWRACWRVCVCARDGNREAVGDMMLPDGSIKWTEWKVICSCVNIFAKTKCARAQWRSLSCRRKQFRSSEQRIDAASSQTSGAQISNEHLFSYQKLIKNMKRKCFCFFFYSLRMFEIKRRFTHWQFLRCGVLQKLKERRINKKLLPRDRWR